MKLVVAGAVLLLAAAGTCTAVMQAEAGEAPPPPLPAQRVVPPAEPLGVEPPAAPPKPVIRRSAQAELRVKHFVVYAPTHEVAFSVATLAEAYRRELALAWLGKELPDWKEPCPVHMKITMEAPAGATTFTFDGGKVSNRKMELQGPLDKVLASTLPHEIAHTVLADHFGRPIPRWADEGAAILSEPSQQQERHEHLARALMLEPGKALPVVGTPGPPIPLRRLFPMTSYPPNVMALHAQGYSVTRFLTGRKDRKTFLAFVGQGMKGDWDAAARGHYGFKTVEELEDAWLASLRQPRVIEAPRATPNHPDAQDEKDGLHGLTIHSLAPLTAQARIMNDGKLRLSYPVTIYVPAQSFIPGEGDAHPKVVTTYRAECHIEQQDVDPAEVRCVEVGGTGKPVRSAIVALRKQGAERKQGVTVLVARDDGAVAPFYLSVVRPGTLLLTVPGGPPPHPAPAARIEPTGPLSPPTPRQDQGR
jgi:hypothetical protein